MNRIIIVALLCIASQLFPSTAFAQIRCVSICDAAEPINCFPFIATLPDDENNSGPIPGCGGAFSLNNTSWYQFAITSDVIAIVASPRFCEQGLGYQAGLYTDCDPNAPALALQCNCTAGQVTFSANGINPGIYYLMFDGCAGDVCDLDVELTMGTSQPIGPFGPIDQPIATTTDVCPGTVVTITVEPVAGTDVYDWNFPNGVVPLSINGNQTTVIWGSNSGSVSVSATSFCLDTTIVSPPLDFTVTSYESFVFGEYCFPDELGYFYAPTGSHFPAGVYDITLISQQGCDSIIHLSVVEYTSPINVVNAIICDGGSVVIGGTVFTAPGTTTIVLPNASLYGCDSTIIAIVDNSPPIILQETVTLASCNSCNGQIDLAITGGTPPFSFAWSNNQTSQNISSLCAGDYTVVVTDQAGCTTEATYTVGNAGGSSLAISSNITHTSCAFSCDGVIELSISCGTPPYQIDWSAGLPDDQLTVDGLCEGVYSVTIIDSNNISGSTVLTISSPTPIELNSSFLDISCFGNNDGSIALSVSGGTTPYQYVWSDPSIGNANSATGLAAGDYTIEVLDNNSCYTSTTITIAEPPELIISTNIVNVTCTSKGSATATVSGGVPPYTYQWNNGISTASADNLDSGIYLIEIQDSRGCYASDTVEIINECCELAIHLESSDIICGAQNTGSISVVLDTAGQQPYTFEWSDLSLPNEDMVTGLSAGTYTLTMTDAEGCTVIDSVTIVQECCPEDFRTELMHESCQGINDGSASVTINNPTTPPYTFEWSDPNLPEEAMVDNLSPGIYFVTVTNGDDCSAVDTIEIESYLDLEVTTTPADCNGQGGTATATASGFFLNYFWSNGGTGSSQQNLAVGEYSVTVYSIFGACRSSTDFNIEIDENCDPINDPYTPIALTEVTPVNSNFSMQISPNPVISTGQLHYHLEQKETVSIAIYDAQGRQLKQLETANRRVAGYHRLQVDCSEWSAGLYFVEMKTESGGREVMKWMKVR